MPPTPTNRLPAQMIDFIWEGIGAARTVQVAPSGLVTMNAPAAPAKRPSAGDQARQVIDWVPLVLVQVFPSVDVSVNPLPTRTKRDPDQAIALYAAPESAARCTVQAAPSGETRIVPAEPSATNCDPVQTTAISESVVPEVCFVQVSASGELAIAPASPTPT